VRNAEVIRQWQILRQIETSRTGVTIHELAEDAGVTTRTIRRDLQALQEAGFAVYDEGEEHDTKRWKLDAAPFRSVEAGLGVQDVAALYLSRSIVEALSAWPLADELRVALGKLEKALRAPNPSWSTLPGACSRPCGTGA
jgi:predicted DNA-binding transcriptional regulator YafY